MKTKQLLISLTLGLGLTLALLWLLSGGTPSAYADSPHYVAPNCTGVPAPCHTTIQEAVDAAVPGDEILVASGVYTGVNVRPRNDITTTGVVTQVVYISKTVTIQGGYTTTNWTMSHPITQPTTLDAQGQGRVFYITGDISPTIEGLRITGGDAEGLGGGFWPWMDAGGGMYIISATATISNSWVYSNTSAWDGGGLYLSSSTATLSGNTVAVNTASRYGGGLLLYYSDATLISNNQVFSNTSWSWGGGLALWGSDATLSGNIISDNKTNEGGGGLFLVFSAATLNGNVVATNTTTGYGGGVYLGSSPAMLSGNMVTTNAAGHGGGLYVDYYSYATLSGNTIAANSADRGGGLYLSASDPTLINNVVADNQASDRGSGLYIEISTPRLLHTTIARNSDGDGSGVHVTNGSSVVLTNTILVSHTVGITVTSDNTVTLEATLWGTDTWANDTDWGGAGTIVTGTRNYWGAPAFVNPDAGDYHIGLTSAAIDKGVNAGVTTDIDGQSRDARPDLGADEHCKIYFPIILKSYP